METNDLFKPKAPTNPDQQPVTPCPPTSWLHVKQSLEATRCPRKKFIRWHLLQSKLSYDIWNKSTPKESDKGKKAQVCFASGMGGFCRNMEKLAARTVSDRPIGDPALLSQWEQSVKEIAEMAFNKACDMSDGDSIPTFSKIRDMKVSNIKKHGWLYKSLILSMFSL